MERMMEGMNGGMETSAPMSDMGGTDGGGTGRPAPKRRSTPKAKKRKPKAKARKPAGAKRTKGKARAKARKSGGSKRAKKRSRRR